MIELSNRELAAILTALHSYEPEWDEPRDDSFYSAADKIRTELHAKLKQAELARPRRKPGESVAIVETLRKAALERRKVAIRYVDADGEITERVIHPLAFTDAAQKAMLRAWCELRDEERNFRTSRIGSLKLLPHRFVPQESWSYRYS